MTKYLWLLLIFPVLILGKLIVFPNQPADPNTINLQTTPAPWSANTNDLKQRLQLLNIPALVAEGTAFHIHQHIDIFINGTSVAVPANIGISPNNDFISPIHTHDTLGIIHVESPVVQTFTLGQFFDVWGVRFTDTCLGSYCNDSNQTLKLFNNGQPIAINFRSLPLTSLQQISIIFGTNEQLPKPIPFQYNFPSGY